MIIGAADSWEGGSFDLQICEAFVAFRDQVFKALVWILALQVHWSRSILNSERGWILKSTQNDKTLKTEWKAGKDCTIHELAPPSGTTPLAVRTAHPQRAVLANRLTVRRKQKGKLQEVVHLTRSSLLFLLFSKAPIKSSQGDGTFQY